MINACGDKKINACGYKSNSRGKDTVDFLCVNQ